MKLLFLLWFYPRSLSLKFGQKWVSNRGNVTFVVVVVAVVDINDVVVIVVVDPTNLPLKFGLNWVRTAEISMTLSLRWVVGGGCVK